ncbi:MAG: DUF3613 domain-containing protein [Halomonas sp.]|nr:DUF3613 domain-containing protein [Halomonas sp.]MBP5981591.1 DUF3613 domain-containing protein [Halomonas sp.]
MTGYRWISQIALGALLAGALTGCAQHSGRDSAAAQPRMLAKGDTVADSWLQIQREGSQASANPQRLSTQEQELASQRWLDSFTHPIPDFFERDEAGGFGEE